MSYIILLGNEPDPDGDYRAEIVNGNECLKLFFRKDREDALNEAQQWCDAHASYDPANVERIEYPGHSLRIA